MKHIIIPALAALSISLASPVLADDPHHNFHNNGHMMAHRPMPQRDPHRFHQGQAWHGHHLVYRGGYWGYVQPTGVFVQITL